MKTDVQIHPTAIIEPGATLAQGVTIGAFAYIGAEVVLGAGCIIHHHGTVEGRTHMGAYNEVFPYTLVGGKTHDLKYTEGSAGLIIGDRNVFREYVSVHSATKTQDATIIGNNNTFLAYSHVAHDCIIGNSVVMSSHSALAGHVIVEDFVNVGWNVGVHQYCSLGVHSMIGACSKIVQNVLPYMLVDGNPAQVRTINKIGLSRRGFDQAQIEAIRGLYLHIYKSEYTRSLALTLLKEEKDPSKQPFAETIAQFVERADSARGIA